MSKLIAKLLVACGLVLASASLISAQAADLPKTPFKAAKAKPKAKAVKPAAEAIEEDGDPDIAEHGVTEYSCELGNKVTIYQNDGDDSHIALRWKARIHRLASVGTTTGAKRFENKNFGLIWIGIPSKGMLLDSKLNRQLANECKNAEQAKPPVMVEAEPKKS